MSNQLKMLIDNSSKFIIFLGVTNKNYLNNVIYSHQLNY